MSEGDYRLQPTYVQAADQVSRLTEFAFRGLSASNQLKQIDEVVSEYRSLGVSLEKPAELNDEGDEDVRVKTVMELFSKQILEQGRSLGYFQYFILFGVLQKFRDEEGIFLFRQLGSNDQQELIEKMLDQMKIEWWMPIKEDILNPHQFPEESEDDFRLRRFTKLFNAGKYFLWDSFGKKEAEKYLLNSGKEITELPHAELWVGVSRIWFETLSADEQGEHIAVLTRKLLGDEAEGKQPGESEADFRVRRLKELFEKLEPDSQQYLLEHIQTTLRHYLLDDLLDDLRDLHRDHVLDDLRDLHRNHVVDYGPQLEQLGCLDSFGGRSSFDNEKIKFINPHPRAAGGVGTGGTTSSAQGTGGDGGQGTSSTTTSTQAR